MTGIARDEARRVRVVVLDADGVMTDGGVYMASGADGALIEMRRFHVHDGIAVHMLREAGILVAIVSSKISVPVRDRATALGIDEIHQVSPYGKLQAVEGILRRAGVDWSSAAFLGDDLADLPVLREVGLPAAVGNAVPEVKDAAVWRGRSEGGSGAVREFAEALLRARGEWERLVREYVERCTREWESADD